MLITDAAVREAAANLAQSLGGDWVIDTAAPADGAAHLVYSDGRGISFRPIFGGTTVQLWITGCAAPPLPDGATLTEQAAHEAQIAARLAEGHRYNKAANLVTEDDEDPERIILRTLEEDLLPAFEYKPRYVGHRPWAELFDRALVAATAEHDATPAAANTDEDTEPQHAESNSVDQEAEGEPSSEVDEAQKPEEVPDEETTHALNSPGAGVEPEASQPPSPETELERPSESAPAVDDNRGEVDEQPSTQSPPATNKRARKSTPKRRPKASAT